MKKKKLRKLIKQLQQHLAESRFETLSLLEQLEQITKKKHLR